MTKRAINVPSYTGGSTYWFGALIRKIIDDENVLDRYHLTQDGLQLRLLGRPLTIIASGRRVMVDSAGWSLLQAGSRMEELALQLQRLSAEREVFHVLQERTQ